MYVLISITVYSQIKKKKYNLGDLPQLHAIKSSRQGRGWELHFDNNWRLLNATFLYKLKSLLFKFFFFTCNWGCKVSPSSIPVATVSGIPL